jgi:hypothetical protein
MRDEIAGRKYLRIRELTRLESESRLPHSGDLAAIQNVQPQGLRRILIFMRTSLPFFRRLEWFQHTFGSIDFGQAGPADGPRNAIEY